MAGVAVEKQSYTSSVTSWPGRATRVQFNPETSQPSGYYNQMTVGQQQIGVNRADVSSLLEQKRQLEETLASLQNQEFLAAQKLQANTLNEAGNKVTFNVLDGRTHKSVQILINFGGTLQEFLAGKPSATKWNLHNEAHGRRLFGGGKEDAALENMVPLDVKLKGANVQALGVSLVLGSDHPNMTGVLEYYDHATKRYKRGLALLAAGSNPDPNLSLFEVQDSVLDLRQCTYMGMDRNSILADHTPVPQEPSLVLVHRSSPIMHILASNLDTVKAHPDVFNQEFAMVSRELTLKIADRLDREVFSRRPFVNLRDVSKGLFTVELAADIAKHGIPGYGAVDQKILATPIGVELVVEIVYIVPSSSEIAQERSA